MSNYKDFLAREERMKRQVAGMRSYYPLKRKSAKSSALKNKITMTKKKFVGEHKKLVKALETGKGLREEAREQKAELRKYE